MSLLKRIESARPGAGEVPSAPGQTPPPGSPGGGGPQAQSRMLTQAPVRESFRDVKFRIQSRVIQDLDPKLDLSNQVEVRRQIEEIFGRVIDEEGLALTRAERVRMVEQIT
ncbi:MAG: CpaF family protein, partial [Candidatus Limnocylindrales bacterium]